MLRTEDFRGQQFSLRIPLAAQRRLPVFLRRSAQPSLRLFLIEISPINRFRRDVNGGSSR